MIAGAHILWQAPFAVAAFEAALEGSAPAHLVAPAGIAVDLGESGLLTPDRVASLTLIVDGGDFDPVFDHDLDADQVFVFDANASGPTPFGPLVDPTRT